MSSYYPKPAIMMTATSSCTKTSNQAAATVPDTSTIHGRSYYVSNGGGADNNNGLSKAAPFKTIGAGVNAANGEDTVFVMKGIYTAALSITKSGAANAYITLKANPSDTPRIYISANSWNALSINGSYIAIEGLEFQGDNANITYTDALAAYNAAVAGGAPQAANFSLSPGSPAIDAGTTIIFAPTDIKGISRPQGAEVDCGAYEK